MDNQIICTKCNSSLNVDDEVALCAKCDLYIVRRITKNSTKEFLELLGGKRFIYTSDSNPYVPDSGWLELIGSAFTSNLLELADAMEISNSAVEVRVSEFEDPKVLEGVVALVEKMHCRRVILSYFVLTAQAAPYLAKIMSLAVLKSIELYFVTFTEEGCKVFADVMQPEHFSKLVFRDCTIHSRVPILNALMDANITFIRSLTEQSIMNDEEFEALTNVVKNNKHLLNIIAPNLSSKQTRKFAEAVQLSSSITDVLFERCDIVTAIPAIVKAIQTSKTIARIHFSKCEFGVALLTELCEGIKQRKSISDIELVIQDRGYKDSLQPVKSLIEANTSMNRFEMCAEASPTEWISLFESLKTNTTLKTLDINTNNLSVQSIEALIDALKANATLQTLYFDTSADIDLAPLIMAISEQNRLKMANIRGIRGTLDMARFCNLLKKNTKLQSLSLSYQCSVEDSETNLAIFKEMLEENYSLLDCNIIWCLEASSVFGQYKERNINLWITLKQNMIILLFNMARNPEAMTKLLPIEIWIEIFKRICPPLSPDNGFEDFAKQIFKHYELY